MSVRLRSRHLIGMGIPPHTHAKTPPIPLLPSPRVPLFPPPLLQLSLERYRTIITANRTPTAPTLFPAVKVSNLTLPISPSFVRITIYRNIIAGYQTLGQPSVETLISSPRAN